VLTAASAVPKLGWIVFFEQPTSQALAPIRDQLLRGALLIGLGLLVAILAGTILARRMLVPITALRAGARRLGAGDFSHRIDVRTHDELEELAGQFNGMAGQLQETYAGLESKVLERTRDLAQSIVASSSPWRTWCLAPQSLPLPPTSGCSDMICRPGLRAMPM